MALSWRRNPISIVVRSHPEFKVFKGTGLLVCFAAGDDQKALIVLLLLLPFGMRARRNGYIGAPMQIHASTCFHVAFFLPPRTLLKNTVDALYALLRVFAASGGMSFF